MPPPTIVESRLPFSFFRPCASAAKVMTQNALAQIRNAGIPRSTRPSKVKLIDMAMPMAAPMTPSVKRSIMPVPIGRAEGQDQRAAHMAHTHDCSQADTGCKVTRSRARVAPPPADPARKAQPGGPKPASLSCPQGDKACQWLDSHRP